MADVMLTAKADLHTGGQLRVVIDGGTGRFDLSCDTDHKIELRQNGRLLAAELLAATTIPPGSAAEWTFSLFDRQALVAVDDRVVLVVPYEARDGVARPGKVAVYGLRGTIREPTVWHDAYYEYRYGDRPLNASVAPASGAPEGATWRLGPREFFVLGDNAEISDDSRSWLAGPGLDAKLLFGKPLGVR
jgi:hypothetical protein